MMMALVFQMTYLKLLENLIFPQKLKNLRSKSGLGLGTFIGKTLLERKKAEIEFSSQFLEEPL